MIIFAYVIPIHTALANVLFISLTLVLSSVVGPDYNINTPKVRNRSQVRDRHYILHITTY